MLKECVEIADLLYEELKSKNPLTDKVSFISDDYSLGLGTYILMNLKGGIVESVEIEKESQKDNIYRQFSKYDYLSKLIDMNKPVCSHKVIHSNNYLSFYVKKENIGNKLNENVIKEYYEFFKNPSLKYKGKSKKLYEEFELLHDKPDCEKIEIIEKIIIDFFINQAGSIKKDKNYLKIFFQAPDSEYQKEGLRYTLLKIYNSNEFNFVQDEKNYGLPNDNMGLNTKKPYLENKTRKNKIPVFLSGEEVLNQKIFFDLIMNCLARREYNIYLSEEGLIESYNNGAMVEKEMFNGFYLRAQKGKEVQIVDFSVISDYSNLIDIEIENLLNIKYEKFDPNLTYGKILRLSDLQGLINNIFYNKWLVSNYYTDAKDIKTGKGLNDKLKGILISTRSAWNSWFYKGTPDCIKRSFEKISLEIILNSIIEGHITKAKEQFNLRAAILNFFNKNIKIGEDMKQIIEKLALKMSHKPPKEDSSIDDFCYIESGQEFLFAVGQAANFLINLSKSSSKKDVLFNPILNSKNIQRIKDELAKMYIKYNYSDKIDSPRFKRLYSMIGLYGGECEITKSDMIAGYLSKSLVYMKNEEQ